MSREQSMDPAAPAECDRAHNPDNAEVPEVDQLKNDTEFPHRKGAKVIVEWRPRNRGAEGSDETEVPTWGGKVTGKPDHEKTTKGIQCRWVTFTHRRVGGSWKSLRDPILVKYQRVAWASEEDVVTNVCESDSPPWESDAHLNTDQSDPVFEQFNAEITALNQQYKDYKREVDKHSALATSFGTACTQQLSLVQAIAGSIGCCSSVTDFVQLLQKACGEFDVISRSAQMAKLDLQLEADDSSAWARCRLAGVEQVKAKVDSTVRENRARCEWLVKIVIAQIGTFVKCLPAEREPELHSASVDDVLSGLCDSTRRVLEAFGGSLSLVEPLNTLRASISTLSPELLPIRESVREREGADELCQRHLSQPRAEADRPLAQSENTTANASAIEAAQGHADTETEADSPRRECTGSTWGKIARTAVTIVTWSPGA